MNDAAPDPAGQAGPLSGLRVIELAQIMAGPSCGALLADLGAEVIKVEKMPGGDDTRRYAEPSVNGESAAFMMMNRNKRGIAVDLKTDGGRQVLRRLAAGADVLTENYRRGALDRLGLGPDALHAVNPALNAIVDLMADEALAAVTLSGDVTEALGSLKEEFRTPMVMCDLIGMTYEEIANAMIFFGYKNNDVLFLFFMKLNLSTFWQNRTQFVKNFCSVELANNFRSHEKVVVYMIDKLLIFNDIQSK